MKPGDYYTDFVSRVLAETDSGFSAKTGGWVEGPDGRRDMDVEVRGTIQGKPYFCLVECKDWGRKVGIGVVDALDSKRRDLGADRAVVYSNSGFTRQAVRKGHRVSIELAAALCAHDPKVSPRLMNRYIVPSHMPADWMVRLMVCGGSHPSTPFGLEDIYFDALPLQNWVHRISALAIRGEGGAIRREIAFIFSEPQECQVRDAKIIVAGFHLRLDYRRELVYQDAPIDMTRGAYEIISNNVRLSQGESVIFGPFNNERWRPLPKGEVGPMTLSQPIGAGISMVFRLIGAVPPHPVPGEPQIDDRIVRCTLLESTETSAAAG